jgi:geranylgeranyl diphosphate synthase type II
MVTTGEKVTEEYLMSDFNLSAYLSKQQAIVEDALEKSLPVAEPEKIYQAMRYSLLAGGKRLRPILCLASCQLMGGDFEIALPTACALEMIHTMSLIHDDLPAMDNDDYRRGKLTNHKVYGENIAILAGDGLLAYAFEHVGLETKNVPPQRILDVIVRLGKTVGATGLVGGQVLDLESEGKTDITSNTLTEIHTRKTGALLESSVLSGAILAGANSEDLARLAIYARNIGLSFQIVDDILDITSTNEELGKTAGKDIQAEKATYPKLWGIDASKKQAHQLINDAIEQLSVYKEKAEPLRAIAAYIVHRKN